MIEDNIINKEANERTVLVGLATRNQNEAKTAEYLDELAFLADTAGAQTVERFVQKLDYPNPRTYDRTSLILDIFAKRAQTATARTQVELAQYQYLLPRLTRMWTHLERQRGGIGMRGPGETQIETDRRIILDKIARLKDELVNIDRPCSAKTEANSPGQLLWDTPMSGNPRL